MIAGSNVNKTIDYYSYNRDHLRNHMVFERGLRTRKIIKSTTKRLNYVKQRPSVVAAPVSKAKESAKGEEMTSSLADPES